MKKLVLASVLLICSLATLFADQAPGSYEIKSYLIKNNGIYIEFDKAPPGINYQYKWWGTHAVILRTHENYKTMAAAVLSAYVTGMRIHAIHYHLQEGQMKSSHNNYEGYNFMEIYTFMVRKQ